jgi:hypothetical protein
MTVVDALEAGKSTHPRKQLCVGAAHDDRKLSVILRVFRPDSWLQSNVPFLRIVVDDVWVAKVFHRTSRRGFVRALAANHEATQP